MSKSYLDEILENTEFASKQWEEFSEQYENIVDFKKNFHLRPTRSGVTFVSTIKDKPMRGKKVGKTSVYKHLKELYRLTTSVQSQEELLKALSELNFDDRKKASNQNYEEEFQAKMIADMSDNQSLKEFLKVDQLIFIASEFIIHDQMDHSDRKRIDIIAFDGKSKLFFFELKTEDSKADATDQLSKYIETYGSEKKSAMLRILAKYPINSVQSDNIDIEGYAVYGYGEQVNFNDSVKVNERTHIGIIKFS